MKKKLTAIFLCVAMLAIAIAGGTMAYFTDKEEVTNTFTTGNVEIKLTEAAVQTVTEDMVTTDKTYKVGDLIAKDKDNDRYSSEVNGGVINYGKIYPGQSIFKDPTIENIGSEDAYIAAKVTITSEGDISKVVGVNNGEYLGIAYLMKGGLADLIPEQKTAGYKELPGVIHERTGDDGYLLYQVKDDTNDAYVLYFLINKEKKIGEKVVLFDTITIDSTWDNEQMQELKGLQIKVEAFAVQKYGFTSCYDAVKAAFPDEFLLTTAIP